MDWIGTIVAGLAGFAFGAAWYITLGERWRIAAGLSEEQVKQGGSKPTPYIIAVLCAVLVAETMRLVFLAGDLSAAVECTAAGFALGAFLAAPWLVVGYGFAQRSPTLAVIDAGHVTRACTVIGFVLSLFL